jgi:hypothetical protein
MSGDDADAGSAPHARPIPTRRRDTALLPPAMDPRTWPGRRPGATVAEPVEAALGRYTRVVSRSDAMTGNPLGKAINSELSPDALVS